MKMFCLTALACLHMASAQAQQRGVKIKSQKASIELGLRGDVALRRSGSNLKIDAKLVQAQALQANSFKVGDMDLDLYIESIIRKRIKPQILNCKPGYTGPFCDQMCTNGDLSKEVYTDGCKTSCKTGFGSMDGKCISLAGAPCNIPNSNKQPGKACKCLPFFPGKITWKGAVASGQCKACGVVSGFNADLEKAMTGGTGWTELVNWRSNANNELYENGGEFKNQLGRFYPKQSGYFLCNANVRLDSFSGTFSRLLIAVNAKKDVNNGLHTIEGNGGSTNSRSMMVSGTLQLNKGQFASVYVFSSTDNIYTIGTASGFSCHQLDSKIGFHAEKDGNQDVGSKKWSMVQKWRVSGTMGVYNAGKAFSVAKSVYTAPVTGVHFCYAMLRIDGASRNGFIRMNVHFRTKPDELNGFHAVRGNGDSTNFGSLNVAGTIYLKKGDTAAVSVFSSEDKTWKIQSESGWGCHNLASNVGFHATPQWNQKFGKNWNRVTRWNTAGNSELYAMGGGGVTNTGYFEAPYFGYYICATQVRIDFAATNTKSLIRVIIAVDGQIDANNGLHSVDGNEGSSNFRTLRVAGSVKLEQGSRVSVHIFSSTDALWTLNKESGFSCNRLKSRPGCPKCEIANSNMKRGKDCACKPGYKGKIVWKGETPTGTCKAAACTIKNSNKKPGPDCKCKNGFTGQLKWVGTKVTGTCKAAPCWIPGSNNKPGPACKCLPLHNGKLTWVGGKVTGSCNICGANSGFNADLTKTITMTKSKVWKELTNWKSSGTSMYETNQKEFDNAKGRFKPKQSGYFLCNANVRLDGVAKTGYSRLLIAINGKTDVNNGLHTIEGNGGSTNYRSMMVSGTLEITKGDYVSVLVYSFNDNNYKIQDQSGFSCHRFDSMQGFHAEKVGNQKMTKGVSPITGWRISGAKGLYNVGGGYNIKNGRYVVPRNGVFFCAAMIRMDGTNSATSNFRLNLVINSQTDYSNGFHAYRGNKASSNYGSLNLAGTLNVKKADFISLITFSSADTTWTVSSESGWGCQRMNTKVGFHADQSADQPFQTGWNRITAWRTAGNGELYAMGDAKLDSGYFTAPVQGYYACAAQVVIEFASSADDSYFRLLIGINNQMNVNNGMHAIDGNGGSWNRRSMRVAGTVYLKKGNRVSVNIYSKKDVKWTAQHASGFSCHLFTTHVVDCPKCNVANSNKVAGPGCKCLPGFKGALNYDRSKKTFTGKCAKAKCDIKNSNMLDGTKCKCKSFFTGKITWDEDGAQGSCRGCGEAKGFNADLVKTISAKKGWREINNWRTTGNNEYYESDGSLENGSGRFKPKQAGYYLCNANVRLDGFTDKGYSRLIIAVSGKKDPNNGLHTIEGNGGSTNYRSMMVTGTLYLNKTDYASVFVFSSGDNDYKIHDQSGFSCQILQTKIGFHAEKTVGQNLKKGWKEVNNWRVAGVPGLYSVGGGFNGKSGRYKAPKTGVYYCYASLRIDGANTGYFRMSLNLNNAVDVNNGFNAVRGNKDSKNYGSSSVAGTFSLKKAMNVSVYVFSSTDESWKVQSESGWGCHQLGSDIGFHAALKADLPFKTSWNRLKGWRTNNNNELYNNGGQGINADGFYKVPTTGYYVCAAQVRIDEAAGTFRALISVNGGTDVNNGMHAIDGNGGSSNFRTIRVAGTVSLTQGNTVSVYVFSDTDSNWKVQQQSGFSCNMVLAKQPCPVCNIANSNKLRGPKCKCKTGYVGNITWTGGKPKGTCKPVACPVKNSNKKPGPACACADGFKGKITWKKNKPSGTCTPAKCNIGNSNKKAGTACKCNKPYTGTISWMGATAVGQCVQCGTNSGFNADLQANMKGSQGWKEIGRWRTNANTELYESHGEFDNIKGRFTPKKTGYYLCSANVALDGFTNFGFSRLLIGVNNKRDVNNGLHAIEGNGGSTNYRSLNVAGTLMLKKGDFASVLVYSSNDNEFFVRSESGFSCHAFTTKFGFHADKDGGAAMKTGWKEVAKWRVTGTSSLYTVGGGFNKATGQYKAPKAGAYFCGAMIRLDGASKSSYFRVNLNLNRKPDFNNGFHVIRGNKGSANYGTMNVAGSVYLKKNDTMSVYVYSRYDNVYTVQSESGWGCHLMGSGIGFHADASETQTFKTGWSRLSKWRTAGNDELYAQGGSPNAQGYYKAPEAGYFMCATQVRIDSASNSRFRMIIAINGQVDLHNGLHVNDGNQGSTNYRSLRIAGSVHLKKGDRTSVHIYSFSDKEWKVQSESGFSCHMFLTKLKCPDDDKATKAPTKPKATKPKVTKATKATRPAAPPTRPPRVGGRA